MDSVAADVTARLDAEGVQAILLKGASVADWLYQGEVRAYEDCDLLVAPEDRDRAQRALSKMGFVIEPIPVPGAGLGHAVSEPWSRGFARVDLHTSFWGMAADPAVVWTTLWGLTEVHRVARRQVRVLEDSARLLLVSLHAVHHGPRQSGPMEDFRRAVELGTGPAWDAAYALASKLGADRSFLAGCALTPAAGELAAGRGWPSPSGIEAGVAAAGLPMSDGFERLALSRGTARVKVIRAELLPAPAFMRWRYAVARRGSTGLAAAYIARFGEIAVGVARALRAWARLSSAQRR